MDCCEAAPHATSIVTIGGALGLGLVGSLHCVGMCGPLIASAEAIRPGQFTPWKQLPMHAGRIITYGLLGAVFGVIGHMLNRGGAAGGVQGVASMVGGAAMILFALVILNVLPWKPLLNVSESKVQRMVSALSRKTAFGGLTMGLLWGMIPCGLVWAALASATATGSVFQGALLMMLFGVGTTPSLLIVGGLGGLIGPRLRRRMPQIAAASIIFLGLLMFLRGAAGAELIPHSKGMIGVPLF